MLDRPGFEQMPLQYEPDSLNTTPKDALYFTHCTAIQVVGNTDIHTKMVVEVWAWMRGEGTVVCFYPISVYPPPVVSSANCFMRNQQLVALTTECATSS